MAAAAEGYQPVAALVDAPAGAADDGRQQQASERSVRTAGRPSRRSVFAGVAALGLVVLALVTNRALPKGLLRRFRTTAGQVADEMKLAGRQFCCLAAVDAGDPCGSCWDGAVNLDSSWCGQAEENCESCGEAAFWCAAQKSTPAPTAEPTLEPTPAPTQGDGQAPSSGGELIDFSSRPDASLYCISLIRPDSDEVELTKKQLDAEVGMFSCNAYTVYSNKHFALREDPLVSTAVIPGSLQVKRGGIWFTALNSGVFVRLWNKVFEDGRYSSYDWTIKLDADTVFLADRMRSHLRLGSPYPGKSYFNNCKIDAMHGPIEVLSRGAMDAFHLGIQRCRDANVTDESMWGEDVFVRQCLDWLGVSKVDDWQLLSETACDEDLSQGCISGKVSFHPFKDADGYFKCLEQAKGVETTTTTASVREASSTTPPPPDGYHPDPDARPLRTVRWLADNSELKAETEGLGFRRSPKLDDMLDTEWVYWGDVFSGELTEDGGWVRSRGLFLPVKLKGVKVLRRQAFWEADNSQLQDPTVGIGYRDSRSLDDKVEHGKSVLWGDIVEGSPTPDGDWLRVGGRFLPMKLNGVPVLRRWAQTDSEGGEPPAERLAGDAPPKQLAAGANGAPGDHAETVNGEARPVAA